MKVAIVGASGYVGAELIALISAHEVIRLEHVLVSENSDASGQLVCDLHPKLDKVCHLPLIPFSEQWFVENVDSIDAVFFATPHEYSALWAEKFLNAGKKVFDLSGGFRLNNAEDYPKYYGFKHANVDLLQNAIYGLADWYAADIANASLIAVPGCYPTASLTALKPITEHALQLDNTLIVINGISGVSGAGRKASLATSFNEVSLTPYNLLQHRHQPEITQEAGAKVIFNPHLAPFKRGLLTTVTLQLKQGVTISDVSNAYTAAYQHSQIVRIKQSPPKIDDVVHTPFADVYWQYDEQTQTLVACCAIDNLLKGAASQAIQCANISLGLPNAYCLVKGALL
ncbi:N-acetyl-gamma-glutamyl-phosphate reductase [Thalassotalea fusca]